MPIMASCFETLERLGLKENCYDPRKTECSILDYIWEIPQGDIPVEIILLAINSIGAIPWEVHLLCVMP